MKVLIITLILIFYVTIGYTHGVKGNIFNGGIGIKAEYTTGEPMSYAKVKIWAPDKKIPFQIGRTDRNGNFCFLPDIKGNWKIVIEDGMGHRLEKSFYLKENLKIKLINKEKNNYKAVAKFFIGILSIMGFFFSLSLFKKRFN